MVLHRTMAFCVRMPLALRTSSTLSLYHPKESHKSVCSRLALEVTSLPKPWPSCSAQGSIDHNQLHGEVDHLPAKRIVLGHVATKTYKGDKDGTMWLCLLKCGKTPCKS